MIINFCLFFRHSSVLKILQQPSPQRRQTDAALDNGLKVTLKGTHTKACLHDGPEACGQIPGSTEGGAVLQQFCVSCIFPTILQSNQQFGAADWTTRKETCLNGFVSSNPQKIYSPFWRCFTAWLSNRSNLTFGRLPEIVWITVLLSTHPFLNAELWLVSATPLLPRTVLNNTKNQEHLASGSSSGAGFRLHHCPQHYPSAALLAKTELGNRIFRL